MAEHPFGNVILSDPEIMGGTPVFTGTRVPAKTLFDYLESGHSLDEFLDDFPSVDRQQVAIALKVAREAVIAHAGAA
jgi:uncharacterized protein (DUF433 family)